ncbi:hypothetical protein GYMLUDRAFT_77420 [Collybiopsis luxurians FD-317 M1]|uniref:Uncharacterized protein n=1 Tax=Collybiopsis luxurians FD-317 M1 TaxID=944289 RepID=A0A0D0C6U1_9AGAR|nr:hypothetical protein GYMLUDRAFT_77420 [Collybiopsis luxurians FD-317 M1]
MNLVFWSLLWSLSLVNALPQPQASVTLFTFAPGITSIYIPGTEWAQPVGTASDGLVTTFVLVNVVSVTGLLMTGGSIELTTSTTTISETVAVSASGWVATAGLRDGVTDCHFTASTSGECLEQIIHQTWTNTWTGSAFPLVLPISTGTVTSPASNPPTTIPAIGPTLTSLSNAALSLYGGRAIWPGVIVSVIQCGVMLGASTVFI